MPEQIDHEEEPDLPTFARSTLYRSVSGRVRSVKEKAFQISHHSISAGYDRHVEPSSFRETSFRSQSRIVCGLAKDASFFRPFRRRRLPISVSLERLSWLSPGDLESVL
jgi:hypothetical protein